MKKLFLGTALASLSMASAVSADEIVVAAQAFTHEPLRQVLEEFGFEEEFGHTVSFESTSAANEDIPRLTTAFRAGNSPYDVVMASDEVFASFAGFGWLAELDDIFDGDLAEDFPAEMDQAISTWSQRDGHTYRIPHEFAFSIYWTRADLLDEWGLEVPTTWEDLSAQGDVAMENGMFAFADALGKGGFGYVYLAAATTQAGGDPFQCDDGYRAAVEWTGQLIDDGKFPQSAINMTYDQLNQEYLNDRLLTIRQWPYFYSVSHGNEDFYAEGKAEPILPPTGPENGKVWVGGHGWSVPASASNLEAGKDFVEFITRSEVQIALAKKNSFFVVPRHSLIEAMSDDDFVAILNNYLQNDRFAPRPFHPQLVAAQGIVEDAAHAYWSGQMSLDEAQSFCKSQIDALG